MGNRKGTEQANIDHPRFLTFCIQVINGFLNCASAGSHNYDDAVGRFMPVIIK